MNDEHGTEALLYAAGELEKAMVGMFEEHLPTCAACRETLEAARGARAWGQALSEGPAPELLAAVLSPAPRRGVWSHLARAAAAMTLAGGVFAAALFAARPQPDLSWQSDLAVRAWTLQHRLGEARSAAHDLESSTQSWD